MSVRACGGEGRGGEVGAESRKIGLNSVGKFKKLIK